MSERAKERIAAEWPEVIELTDVVVTPLHPGAKKSSGLRFGATRPIPQLGHFRRGRAQSIVEVLALERDQIGPVDTVEELTLYGGLLFPHFGHVLAESIHRLWPILALDLPDQSRVLFHPVRPKKTMPYLNDVLNLFGITSDRTIRLVRPLMFRRLLVAPQARQMAGPTILRNYNSILEPSLRRLGEPITAARRLYVCRLDLTQARAGSFFGESAVARLLAASGFLVVYPERHSLLELVGMLRGSEIAIFAEGSAIHALELCGSAAPDVLVIARRPKATRRFGRLLAEICTKWSVSDRVIRRVGISDNPQLASAVVDLDAVLNDIEAFIGTGLNRERGFDWGHDAIVEDVDRLIALPHNQMLGDIHERARALRSATACANASC